MEKKLLSFRRKDRTSPQSDARCHGRRVFSGWMMVICILLAAQGLWGQCENPPDVFNITGGGARCQSDNIGVPIGLSGSEAGVSYQLFLGAMPIGPAIPGTTNSIQIAAPVPTGTYTVIATDNVSGCTSTMAGLVEISSFPCIPAISDPCICKNNATTLANGQFEETIAVQAPGTQTWTVSAVTGLYAFNSPPTPALPVPIPLGTPLEYSGNNTFTLRGIHVDALGYSLSVSNGAGTVLSIGNSCSYPNPVITSTLADPYCLSSAALVLQGNPGDVDFSSAGFTINGLAATVFQPASAGQYTAIYTVNGGIAKQSGADDPGCIQAVSQTVQAVASSTSLICNDLVNVSLDPSCSLVLTADQILEGSYVCYGDYLVELDRSLPLGNGPWEPAILDAADIQKNYAVRVIHSSSGNSCLGAIFVEDKLAPVFQNCGCIPTPVTQFSASLDGDEATFLRPNAGLFCNISANNVFYDTYTFQVQTAGTYTFAQFAAGGDGFGALYTDVFNPLNPCQNFLEADDDDNVPPPAAQGDDFLLSRSLTPGTYVLVVTSYAGNVAYGPYTVSVSGPAPITAGDNCSFTCADKAGLLNGSITLPDPLVSDNCTAVTLTKSDLLEENSCDNSYIYRSWTATDAWGNTSQCTQTLTLAPYTLEDVVFPPDITLQCAGCGVTATPSPCSMNSLPTVFGSDADGVYELIDCSDGSQLACNLGAEFMDIRIEVCTGTFRILRQWTVIDWCSNEIRVHNQLIKIADEEGPSIAVPADMTVSTNPAQCCATVDLPDVIVEDACSGTASISAMVTVYEQYPSGPNGQAQVIATYTLTRPSNNATGEFSLTTFPGNNFWDCDTLGNFGTTPCLPIGRHQVTYMAEDVCGNTRAETFWLTVLDDVPPVATCTQFTTVAIGSDDPNDCYEPTNDCESAGVTWVPASVFNQGSYDNCNDVRITVRRMPDSNGTYSDCIEGLQSGCNGAEYQLATAENDSIKFYCCEVGSTQTVILRVYQLDIDGAISIGLNGMPIYNECMVQVDVQDKIKPTCTPPPNVTVSCENFDPSLWAYGFPDATDNCCLDNNPPTSPAAGAMPAVLAVPEVCGMTQQSYYAGQGANFDTTCNRGTIVRRFLAWDCVGQSSSCTQRVVVASTQNYTVQFQKDSLVYCAGTVTFNAPVITNDEGCELIGVSYNDVFFTVVPDACYKIERTWTIINWCTYNPDIACSVVPRVLQNGMAIRQTKNVTSENCLIYKQVIKVIDQTPPVVTCAPIDTCDLTDNSARYWIDGLRWWDNDIQSHNLCESPTLIDVTAEDFCAPIAAPILTGLRYRYVLFLDLDNNGTMETVVSSADANTRPLGRILYNNYLLPNYFSANAPQWVFDNNSNPYRFDIKQTTNGASLIWRTGNGQEKMAELPHGTHKIKWTSEDGCGNEAVCEKTFTIRDCKPPSVACANVNINLMTGGMATLWANDFFLYGDDNCTPQNILNPTIAVIRADANPGNSYPGGAPQNQSIVVSCDDENSSVEVQLWMMDAAGNADYCTALVTVADNIAGCTGDPAAATVAGMLATETQQGLENASVELLLSSGPAMSYQTDANGVFQFINAVPPAGNYVLTPAKDDNPLNGVTTYDLVLISKHILGLQPLNTPYKIIAADANHSGSVTTFDMVEFRKLILGIYTHLPNNTSWRFVDKAYVFPEPSNPFQPPFPETISAQNVLADRLNEDFVSMKVGDVNNTVIPNSFQSVEDRSSGTLVFDVEDRSVEAGELFTAHFKGTERVLGYQFTINLRGLEVLDVLPGPGMGPDNFAVFQDVSGDGQGALTTSVDGDANAFSVSFRANRAGLLRQMLSVSSRITRAEAYQNSIPGAEMSRMDIAFRFGTAEKASTGVGFELYQNQPNPFTNNTFFSFNLPEAGRTTLRISDHTGRTIWEQSDDFDKGYHSILVDDALLRTAGVYYYTLSTGTHQATKKMIKLK